MYITHLMTLLKMAGSKRAAKKKCSQFMAAFYCLNISVNPSEFILLSVSRYCLYILSMTKSGTFDLTTSFSRSFLILCFDISGSASKILAYVSIPGNFDLIIESISRLLPVSTFVASRIV